MGNVPPNANSERPSAGPASADSQAGSRSAGSGHQSGPPKEGWRRIIGDSRIKGIGQAVLGIAALVFLLWKTDSRQLWLAAKDTNLAYLPLAVLSTVGMLWLMAYRWHVVLGTRRKTIKVSNLFVYYLIGTFFTNFVPGGSLSIDAVRLIYLDREIKDKSLVLSTLLFDRIIGMFTLLTIGLVAALASRDSFPSHTLGSILEISLVMVLVLSVFLLSHRLSMGIAQLIEAIGERIRLGGPARWIAGVVRLISELKRDKATLAYAVAISVLIRVVWSLTFYIIARAMSLPLSLAVVLTFTTIVDLVRMLPVTPNGIGLREGAFVLLLGDLGIAREQALVFSLLSFAPSLLLAVVGGIIYIARGGRGRRAGEAAASQSAPTPEVTPEPERASSDAAVRL